MRSLLFFLLIIAFLPNVHAQVTTRPRPQEWSRLVPGGRFMDRFLPMPAKGELSSKSWGASNVQPRYISNGIENMELSFWGGNIMLGEDRKYHLFVCGWPENSVGGHRVWPESIVFNAVSDHSFGPFVIKDTIGKGHNPEVFRLNDGRYVLYVIEGCYVADNINGPWEYQHLEFLSRDREILDGLSNLTFAKRENGSYLMVNRGGGIWFSETGLSPYNLVTDESAYPKVEGYFEDPVVWRDHIQYNLVVNDWLGRIAFYQRSKNGVDWRVEAGEAYLPGIAKHENGLVEGWYKLERMKVYQDDLGRATQANFAVIDVEKEFDLGSDNHSSKNIILPLTVGRKLEILNKKKIDANTKFIRVKIEAEEGFDPQTDIDFSSLRFGGPDSVNYGGGGKFIRSEANGRHMILYFDGQNNGIPEDEFAAKLLGKTNKGKLLFGYARLPQVVYEEPILSSQLPVIEQQGNRLSIKTTVENFGEFSSKKARLTVYLKNGSEETVVGTSDVAPLKPFEKVVTKIISNIKMEQGKEHEIITVIESNNIKPVRFIGKVE